MMFEPTNAFDIVPRIRSMALEALVNRCMFLTGNGFVHHLKMHHVVTRRRLMTLCAVLRGWGGMQKPRDPPTRRDMTVRTFLAEQVAVRFSVAVTTCAVKHGLFSQL